MSFLLNGFTEELLSLGAEKVAAAPRVPPLSPSRGSFSQKLQAKLTPGERAQLGKLKSGALRGAKGTAATALLYKLINPGASIDDSVMTGGSVMGGGSLGHYLGRRAGLGRKGRAWAGLGGSVAALRALHMHQKNRREKARRK